MELNHVVICIFYVIRKFIIVINDFSGNIKGLDLFVKCHLYVGNKMKILIQIKVKVSFVRDD